jgi:hypothetical protein
MIFSFNDKGLNSCGMPWYALWYLALRNLIVVTTFREDGTMRQSAIHEPTKPYGVRNFAVRQHEKIKELAYKYDLNEEEVLYRALGLGLDQLETSLDYPLPPRARKVGGRQGTALLRCQRDWRRWGVVGQPDV